MNAIIKDSIHCQKEHGLTDLAAQARIYGCSFLLISLMEKRNVAQHNKE